MARRVCLDAGPITLYYQKDAPSKVQNLIKGIKTEQYTAIVPTVILVEAYKHLCLEGGIEHAENCIHSFRHYVKPRVIALTSELILRAGKIKCQYSTDLSYNDAIVIATSLEYRATLQTTEKDFPNINHLRVRTYDFY